MKSYLALLRDVIINGENHVDRTSVGTVSCWGRQWRHDMREGFPLLTTKRMSLRLAFEEICWMLRGSSSAAELREMGVNYWNEWATAEQCAKFGREADDMGPIYGPMMRSFPIGWSKHDNLLPSQTTCRAVDQIAELLNDAVRSPESRRLIVTHWHPYYAKRVTLPPCHAAWHLRVHKTGMHPDELSIAVWCRSIDTFLGLPYDIALYALLLEMLAHALGMRARYLVFHIDDLHVYRTHFEAVEQQLEREPRSLPRVFIDTPLQPKPLDTLLTTRWEHVKLHNYNPRSKISAPVAV